MNRELKFRVWDYHLRSFNVLTNLKYLSADGKLHFWETIDTETTAHFELGDNRYVVQQFTGLKDKNNKEIYEGDIIKVAEDCYAFFDENVLLVVEWENHGFLCFDNLLARDTIVVGNIFENPNLING